MENCPVCKSILTESYIKTNLTTFLFPVPSKLIYKIKKEPFSLNICKRCSHIFQTNINKTLLHLIYHDFYNHYNLDTSIEFQAVYRDQTINFLKKHTCDKGDQKAIDIGCGEGTYFDIFYKMGYECYGIEPSQKSQIAKRKNPFAHISNDFFNNSKTNIFNTLFDIVVMNWVLEHISDVDSFFNTLKLYIKIGTKLFIQVPDIDYYMNHNVPLFYAHEHINYFSAETLSILLKRKGFKIIDILHSDSPALFIVCEYNRTKQGLIAKKENQIAIRKNFLVKNNELKTKIKKTISENSKVIFYGMGLLSFWIGDFCLSNKEKEKITLIDDNIYYYGKIVPSFNRQLEAFHTRYSLNGYAVFITASPVYYTKIKEAIQKKFTGNFKIITIENNDICIKRNS